MRASKFNGLLGAIFLAGALAASATSPSAQTRGRAQTKRKTPAPTQAKPSPQNTAVFNEAVKLANEARDAGRLRDAAENYLKALQINPAWAEGWWYVGTIFYDTDHYVEARNALRNLVSLDPKNGPGWALLGLCEFQTKEYDQALASLIRGRRLGLGGNEALQAVVRYHGALLYIRQEQFEVAFEVLREFLSAETISPKLIEAYGLAIMRMPFLPNEIPADKRELVLIAGRAAMSMAARRKDEAQAAFSELMTRYPNTPGVHYAYGVYLMNHDVDAAMKEFQTELDKSPSHVPSMLQMAFEYLKRNEYETALPLAEKAVQLAPKMYPGRNVLGRTLLELGRVEEAVKHLEEGVKLAPDSAQMHYALARAYSRAGRKEDAARERGIFQELEKLMKAQREGTPLPNNTTQDSPKDKP
ncbi:MAG TPA: tetratricopeptide repeat protein [Blastocatellia bacterium]|nr:tetratricopeptide repeat protein [Blastocatellia bacterium]